MAQKKTVHKRTTVPTTAEAIRGKLRTILDAEMDKPEAGAQQDPRLIRTPKLEAPYAEEAVEDGITGPREDLNERGRRLFDELTDWKMGFANDGTGELPDEAAYLMLDLWEAEGGYKALRIPTALDLIKRHMAGEMDTDAFKNALFETVSHDIDRVDDDSLTVLHSAALSNDDDYHAQVFYDMSSGAIDVYEHVCSSWTVRDDPDSVSVDFATPEGYDVLHQYGWDGWLANCVCDGVIDGPEGYKGRKDSLTLEEYTRETDEGAEWADEYYNEGTATLIALQIETAEGVDPDADEDEIMAVIRKAWEPEISEAIITAVYENLRRREDARM